MRNWMSRLAGPWSGRREVRPPCRPALEHLEDRCLPAAGFFQANLVADLPGPAANTDAGLINPWGLAALPGQPLTVADAGAGQATQYDSGGLAQPAGAPLAITVPVSSVTAPGSRGMPAGIVYNNGPGFVISANGRAAPAQILFATLDGTISGWNPTVDPTHAILAVDAAVPGSYAGAVAETGASYTGLTLAGSLLYAANFRAGTIDVFDQNFQRVSTAGGFVDPGMPGGFAPYNIQMLNGNLYVTYASQDHNPNGGFLDVFNTNGVLLQRLVSQGPLNAPYGLALATPQFGPYGGDLLVGNFGDGHINVFDPSSGALLGTLTDGAGNPFTNEHLWALTFGTGGAGGTLNTLYFTAGVGNEQHGLLGALSPSPAPLTPLSSPVLAAQGQSFTVEPGTTFNAQVASFTAPNPQTPPASFTATIDWGDGSQPAPAQVTATGTGAFAVNGTHTYSTPGSYTLAVTIVDQTGNKVTANAQAAVGNANERFVARVYQDLLNRPVDPAALAYWNAQLSLGVPRTQLVTMLEASEEYHIVEINHLYLSLLNRPVDAFSLAYFTPLLDNGGTLQQVASQILGSDEYYLNHGGTNAGFMEALYHDTLNRPVDGLSAVTYGPLLDAGVPRSSVALAVLSSPEYASDQLGVLFAQYLHQPPNPGMDSIFLLQLEGGALDPVVANIIASNDYFAQV